MSKELRQRLEETTQNSYLPNPDRLAIIAVKKARYRRPTHWQVPVSDEFRVYDLEAATSDTMLDSSLSPVENLALGELIVKRARRLFPNEKEIMARRQAAVDRLNRRAA